MITLNDKRHAIIALALEDAIALTEMVINSETPHHHHRTDSEQKLYDNRREQLKLYKRLSAFLPDPPKPLENFNQ